MSGLWVWGRTQRRETIRQTSPRKALEYGSEEHVPLAVASLRERREFCHLVSWTTLRFRRPFFQDPLRTSRSTLSQSLFSLSLSLFFVVFVCYVGRQPEIVRQRARCRGHGLRGPTDISAQAYRSPLNLWRLFALLGPAFCGIVACCPRVTRIDQQPLPLMASRLVRLAATLLDACQTRLTTQMKRVVISGDATQFYTELVDGPLTMAHRLHTCSRCGWAFAPGSHRPRRFRYGPSSLIRRIGMPEWTLQRLLGALRPLNMTRERSESSRPHDSLRIHFAELEFGMVFHRSNSGAEAVSEGNLPLTPHQRGQWRSGVGGVARTQVLLSFKKLRRGIFTVASRTPREVRSSHFHFVCCALEFCGSVARGGRSLLPLWVRRFSR